MSSNTTASATLPAPHHPNAILTTRQVADWLQVEPRAVARLGVPQLELGHRTRRYRARDVQTWLDQRARLTPKAFRHTYCARRLRTLHLGEPVSHDRVGRELGHGG